MTFSRRPQREPRQSTVTPRPRPVAPGSGLLAMATAQPELRSIAPAATDAAGRRHMGRIKAMGCVCCNLLGREQRSITDVHHIREGRQERNHFLTLPLCHDDCHQGSSGVHGDKRWLLMLKMSEFDLLAKVIALLTDCA